MATIPTSETAMRRALGLWMVTALMLAGSAFADTSVSVVAVDPAASSLRVNDNLSLKVAYHSDVAVRIQAVGMRDGAQVPGARNASPRWPAGDGVVLAWISYAKPTRVDSVDVRVFDTTWRQIDHVQVPAVVTWRVNQPKIAAAPWVTTLNADAQRLMSKQDGELAHSSSFWLLGALISISPLLYLLLQTVLPLVWRGGWRKLALLPLAVMVPALVISIFALIAGSNLWPIWLVLLAPLAWMYLAALLLVRIVKSRVAGVADADRRR